MADNLPGTSDPKFKWNERYCGHIFSEQLARSTEQRGDKVVIKPRYYLHILKYGSSTQLWGSPEMDIEAVVKKFSQEGNSLGLGGKLGGTDTQAAFQEAYDFLQQAVKSERFKDSFPPMLFHLTDGMSATDAKPLADKIRQLSTADGNILVVNAFIGTQTSLNYKGIEDFTGYMDAAEAGPSNDNIRLFEMSSVAPECIIANLKAENIFPNIRNGSRLFFDVRTKEMLKHVIQVIGSLGSRMAG
jgi:hypothetical protein